MPESQPLTGGIIQPGDPVLQTHPDALLFPPVIEEERNQLKNIYQASGIDDPILLDSDRRIHDGKDRYTIGRELGIPIPFIIWRPQNGTVSLLSYVISLNLGRRPKLKHGPKAMAAARAYKLRKRTRLEAKKRMAAGGEKGVPGRKNPPQDGKGVERIPHLSEGKSRDQVGRVFGVSGRSVDTAGRILRNGIGQVIEAVDFGKIVLHAAEQISRGPRKCQAKALQAFLAPKVRVPKSISKRGQHYRDLINQGKPRKEAVTVCGFTSCGQAQKVAKIATTALPDLLEALDKEVLSIAQVYKLLDKPENVVKERIETANALHCNSLSPTHTPEELKTQANGVFNQIAGLLHIWPKASKKCKVEDRRIVDHFLTRIRDDLNRFFPNRKDPTL